MNDARAWQCRKCGAPLDARAGAEFVKCTYCNSAHRVERSSDGVELILLTEAVRKLERIDTRTDALVNAQIAHLEGLIGERRAAPDVSKLSPEIINRVSEEYDREIKRYESRMKWGDHWVGLSMLLVIFGPLALCAWSEGWAPMAKLSFSMIPIFVFIAIAGKVRVNKKLKRQRADVETAKSRWLESMLRSFDRKVQ